MSSYFERALAVLTADRTASALWATRRLNRLLRQKNNAFRVSFPTTQSSVSIAHSILLNALLTQWDRDIASTCFWLLGAGKESDRQPPIRKLFESREIPEDVKEDLAFDAIQAGGHEGWSDFDAHRFADAWAKSGNGLDVPPTVTIVWDPEALSDREYVDLVRALGKLARHSGGVGLRRVSELDISLPCESVVPA